MKLTAVKCDYFFINKIYSMSPWNSYIKEDFFFYLNKRDEDDVILLFNNSKL